MVNGITPQSSNHYIASSTGIPVSVSENTTTAGTSGAAAEDELQDVEFNDVEGIGKTEEEQAIEDVNNQLAKAEKQYADKIEQCNKQIEKMQEQLDKLDIQRRNLTQQLFAGSDTSSIMSGLQQLNSQKSQIINNITSILFNISEFETALEESKINAQESIDKINDVITQKESMTKIQTALEGTSGEIKPGMEMGDIVATLGSQFIDVINSDAEGNAAFSNGVSQHWCADFVTSIVKMACEATGTSIPSGFGSSSVSGLKSWGESNGSFVQTAGKGNKASIISSTIKPGDIMIQKENNSSHTGIFTKVYPDGSFDTVEGNSSDAVKGRHYSANSDKLTGFISMKWWLQMYLIP